MRRFLCLLLLIAGFCALPSAVGAAAGEGGGWGWYETIGRWLNLALLFGLIFYFVRRPLSDFFRSRRVEIQQQLRAAEKAKAEAESRLAEMQARMESLDAELAKIRAEAEATASQERTRIVEEAERDAEKLIASARREIEGLTRGAHKSLKDYAAQLSLELAAQQIKEELDLKADERLIDRFIVKLDSERGSKR